MRLGRILIAIAIIIVIGLVAVYALLNLGKPQQPQGINVVMAVQPIPRGGIIMPEQLGYLEYPPSGTIQGMFTNIGDVIGKRARYDILPGVPVTSNMLVETSAEVAQTGSDASLLIPSGMVAFPIPIDRFSSLAYGLRAGDHVNVIATLLLSDLDTNFQTVLPNNTGAVISPGAIVFHCPQVEEVACNLTVSELLQTLTAQVVSGGAGSPQGVPEGEPSINQTFYIVPSEPQRPRLVSQTLLQDITVLHLGNFLYTDQNGNEVQPQSTTLDAAGNTVSVPVNPPDLITLIVSPQDAVTLNYLIYAGANLTLALRSSGDSSTVTTEAVTLQYLLQTYNIPVPTKLPYGLSPRIDSLNSPTQQDQLPQLAPQPAP